MKLALLFGFIAVSFALPTPDDSQELQDGRRRLHSVHVRVDSGSDSDREDEVANSRSRIVRLSDRINQHHSRNDRRDRDVDRRERDVDRRERDVDRRERDVHRIDIDSDRTDSDVDRIDTDVRNYDRRERDYHRLDSSDERTDRDSNSVNLRDIITSRLDRNRHRNRYDINHIESPYEDSDDDREDDSYQRSPYSSHASYEPSAGELLDSLNSLLTAYSGRGAVRVTYTPKARSTPSKHVYLISRNGLQNLLRNSVVRDDRDDDDDDEDDVYK